MEVDMSKYDEPKCDASFYRDMLVQVEEYILDGKIDEAKKVCDFALRGDRKKIK